MVSVQRTGDSILSRRARRDVHSSASPAKRILIETQKQKEPLDRRKYGRSSPCACASCKAILAFPCVCVRVRERVCARLCARVSAAPVHQGRTRTEAGGRDELLCSGRTRGRHMRAGRACVSVCFLSLRSVARAVLHRNDWRRGVVYGVVVGALLECQCGC